MGLKINESATNTTNLTNVEYKQPEKKSKYNNKKIGC